MTTEQNIKAKIKETTYIVMPDGRTTICQLKLANGFSLIGSSTCTRDFNLALEREIAYKNAIQKMVELEGYMAVSQPVVELPVVDVMKPEKKPAKYGYKVDGTPKKKPGRPRKAK